MGFSEYLMERKVNNLVKKIKKELVDKSQEVTSVNVATKTYTGNGVVLVEKDHALHGSEYHDFKKADFTELTLNGKVVLKKEDMYDGDNIIVQDLKGVEAALAAVMDKSKKKNNLKIK